MMNKVKRADVSTAQIDGVDTQDYPDMVDAYISDMSWEDGTEMTDEEISDWSEENEDTVYELVIESIY